MELIQNNPYRISGVKANASLSDRKQQTNLIAQYLKIGQSAKLDFDITPPLSRLERTRELIDLQGSRIHSTEDKILHSLFWFVEVSGVDKIALKHLTVSKDIEKALSDFEKGCRGFVVSTESYSAILNHSTLQIIAYRQHKDLGKLKSAIAHKFSIVSDSKSLGHLKELVASDGMKTSVQRILELAIPKLKELLKELVPSKNTDKLLLDIFKSNTVIYPNLRNEVIDAMVDRVDYLVNNTEIERERALKNNYTPSIFEDIPVLGELLLDEVKTPLKEIESLLGKSDPVYTDALQKVYEEVNYCGIGPFNKMMSELNTNEGRAHERLRAAADISAIVNLYGRAKESLVGISIPIKETLLNNLDGISRFQAVSTCEFCNSNKVSVSNSLKIDMHKFTSGSQYTYFKDGGLDVPCCSSCKGRLSGQKTIAFIVALVVYGVIAIVTSGILFGIDLFTGFSIGKWWFLFMKKQMYLNEVGKHPKVSGLLNEGYDYGLPSG
tara:strand:- start:6175 stop:7659 length:1485 start_codon:yes stop_codon:yes gene_type:complete